MRKVRKFSDITVWLMSIMLLALSCNDDLDIRQDYGYAIETLPLPKSLKKGEAADLEFSIIREGNYKGAMYIFRYFQSEGTGMLTDTTGTMIPVNRFQSIASDDFMLTYTNLTEEQARLDFVFVDNFGQRVEYTVTFVGKRTYDENE